MNALFVDRITSLNYFKSARESQTVFLLGVFLIRQNVRAGGL